MALSLLWKSKLRVWGCGLQRTWLLELLDAAEVRDQVVPPFPCLLPYLCWAHRWHCKSSCQLINSSKSFQPQRTFLLIKFNSIFWTVPKMS